jgi:ABC-2 type transport system permease protein
MSGRRSSFWSGVFAIAYREATVLRHDQAFLIMVLAQPVIMVLLFGWGLRNEPANVPWLVLDRSQTAASRRLVGDVQATGYFLAPRAVAGYDEGRALIADGDALAMLVVPRDFRRDLERGISAVQLLLDGSDPLTAARVGGYVARVVAAYGSPRAGPREVLARSPGARGIAVRQRFWFNPTLADREFFLGAIAGMLLTNLCLSAMAQGIVGERERGTYEQMIALPTTALQIVLGKMVPVVVIAFAVLFIVHLGMGLVFGFWPRGSWLAMAVVTLPFVLASLAIGVFVSALSRSTAQSVFISVFFILPSFVLSGVMMPYELMPDGVRQLGALLPLRWYQMALRAIVVRGAGLADVLVPLAALGALLAVFLTAASWRTPRRLG